MSVCLGSAKQILLLCKGLLFKEGWLRHQEKAPVPLRRRRGGYQVQQNKKGALRDSLITTPSAPEQGGFGDILINGRVHPSLKRMGLFARQVFVQVPMLDSSWSWLSADARFLFWTRRVNDRAFFRIDKYARS
jgi:hypothetical protein